MNSNIRIHVADDCHVDAIVALQYGLFVEDSGPRDPSIYLEWPLDYGHDYIRQLQKARYSTCLVALDDTIPVGYVTGYIKEWKPLRPILISELESIFVHRQYRNLGIGGQLVAQFKTWSEEQGASRISVNAYADNGDAIRFYERHCFAPRSITLEADII